MIVAGCFAVHNATLANFRETLPLGQCARHETLLTYRAKDGQLVSLASPLISRRIARSCDYLLESFYLSFRLRIVTVELFVDLSLF